MNQNTNFEGNDQIGQRETLLVKQKQLSHTPLRNNNQKNKRIGNSLAIIHPYYFLFPAFRLTSVGMACLPFRRGVWPIPFVFRDGEGPTL